MLASVLGETVHAAKDALAGNKKVADVKKDIVEQTDKTKLTSDFGVREPDTDNWLSASTNGRQGPLLLEDNFAREKVCLIDGVQTIGAFASPYDNFNLQNIRLCTLTTNESPKE